MNWEVLIPNRITILIIWIIAALIGATIEACRTEPEPAPGRTQHQIKLNQK